MNLMQCLRALAACAVLAGAGAALAHAYAPEGLHIRHPWTRATPPGSQVAAAYLLLRNRAAQAERLLGASTPLAARVEMHDNVKEGEVYRMREFKSLEVPAGGKVEFLPSGKHLMLIGLKRPLKEGERIPLVLRFERAGEVRVEIEVEAMTSKGGTHH